MTGPTRRAWDNRPPLEPPPDELVQAYREFLAADERRRRAIAALPEPGAYVLGLTEWPHDRLAQAQAAAAEASRLAVAVYSHPWYRAAQDRNEAERILRDAAAR